MMKNIGKKSQVSAATLAVGMLLSCAAPQAHREAKKDVFGDPSRFESLASGAHETPAVVAEKGPTTSTAPAFEADAARGAAVAPVVEAITTPDAAFAAMVRGNERFVTGAVKGENRDSNRRRTLASGQQPHTIVLSCSDSRVPPELVFDQGLGDIFTVRVAGNVLGSAQVASIEYAIEHLNSKLIVVMGHESCGAVKAALGSGDSHAKHGKHASAGSPDLDWLVSAIKPNIATRGVASVTGEADPKIRKPVMSNVDAVTSQLLVRSKIISEAIHKGSLKVVKGIYGLDSGKVDFWGLK